MDKDSSVVKARVGVKGGLRGSMERQKGNICNTFINKDNFKKIRKKINVISLIVSMAKPMVVYLYKGIVPIK